MQEILPWRQIRERTSDGELGRTVNPLPLGLAGSNPAAPTKIYWSYGDSFRAHGILLPTITNLMKL